MENKITNLPEKIYLNLGELTDDATDFTDLEEVTWSPETVDHNDPCYVHESALQALETALTEKHRAEVENPSQYDVNQLQQLINEAGDTHVEVHAFQLEGALDYINQLRTKNKRLRDYAQHKSNCDMGRLSMSVGVCTCGLDQLLTLNAYGLLSEFPMWCK